MHKLQAAVRREQRQKLLVSLVLLLLGLSLILFFFEVSVILSILGLILLVTGIRFAIPAWRARIARESPLMRTLLHNPRKIVWVYSVVTERQPFGFQFSKSGILYFKLRDGDDLSVSMSPGDLKLVSRFLNRILPHATFGYTADREQWFMADPRMLLRKENKN